LPVQALDQAAARIARGEYDVSVDETGRDEIGRLARTFNLMTSSLRQAREELIRRERIATINRISTSIIHDLRNPLAAIYGGAEMMVDSELSPAQVRRLALNIYRSSRRVQELLQELAGETAGRSHAREACRLREVVEASRDAIAQNAESRRVEVVIDVPEELELMLDRSPMERVFQNLLSNAIEAMANGGQVKVTAFRQEGAALVSVEDTGQGIPAELAGRLFQPFATYGKRNGMGLGLALSRQTVLDHGGDLWVDAECPAGARFWLRLPA
jgi:signal transduction histidine kinase